MRDFNLAACALSLLVSATANAQTTDYGTLDGARGVAGESRPSAPIAATGPTTTVDQPLVGWKVGDVVVAPSITGGWIYDTNIFATRTNRQSDQILLLRPEMSLRSTGASHDVTASAFIESRRNVRFSSEDQINGGVGVGGTFNVNANTQVQGRAQYLRGHETRGAGESVFATTDKPTGFDQWEGAVALNNRFDRVWTSVGVAGLAINYDAAQFAGVSIPQQYRNGVISVANGRIGYVVAPRTSIFVEAAVNRRDFGIHDFDSTGMRTVAGVLLEPGPGSNLRGEAYAGYMYQNYAGVNFETVSTWTYGGAMGFLITPTFTITVEGRREAKESALAGGVSLIESQFGARADYQVASNVVVGAGASYVIDDFQGVGRSDRYWSPLATARYIVNPNLTFGLDYRRLTYNALGAPGADFGRDVYMVSLNGKF
ncbi:MAG: hypothetical protein JWN07_754 [Hyphomicrobiales bacterium]|nr:hypothetical protein [Hyphomicrobiales bacterium]